MKKTVSLMLLSIAFAIPALAGDQIVTHSTQKKTIPGSYIQIQHRQYNPESRSYERPWPFGPESNGS
jgi:hypothetical protein